MKKPTVSSHCIWPTPPLLESDDVLAGTSLPIVVLDTTDTYEFCDPEDILYCHGIMA